MIKEAVKVKGLTNVLYDTASYPEIVKAAYERSPFLGKDPITAEEREVLEIKGRKVEVLNISMPFVTERK